MTLVQGELKLVTDAPDEVSQVWIQAPKERLHGTGMITDGRASEQVKNGVVSFNALPGAAVMVLLVNGIPSLTKKLLIPDKANATLRECIEAVGLADDGTLSALEDLALEVARIAAQIASADRLESWASETASAAEQAQLSKNEANSAANRAGVHESNARQSELNAKQSEVNSETHANTASTKAHEAAGYASSANESRAQAQSIADSAEEFAASASNHAAAAKVYEENAKNYEASSLSAAERAEFAAEETIQQVAGDFATRNYVDAAKWDKSVVANADTVRTAGAHRTNSDTTNLPANAASPFGSLEVLPAGNASISQRFTTGGAVIETWERNPISGDAENWGAWQLKPSIAELADKADKSYVETGLSEIEDNISIFAEAVGKDIAVVQNKTDAIGTHQDDSFTVIDVNNRSALSVNPDGSTTIGSTLIEDASTGFRVLDSDNRVAFEITGDGKTIINDLAGAGGGSTGVTELHAFICAGQSNMSGRGDPVDEVLDVENPRLLQFGHNRRVIEPAPARLDMMDSPLGLSPARQFGLRYLQTQPANVAVLLIPAAHGGTGFTYTPTEGRKTWTKGHADTEENGLYERALAQSQDALTAAQQAGYNVELKGLLWHQGEANGSSLPQNMQAYSERLDALISDFRTDLNVPNLPVIVGEMLPEGMRESIAKRSIGYIHAQTPERVQRTAFAPAPDNAMRHEDLAHFSREGAVLLGDSMYDALPRAVLNVPTGKPRAARDVAAYRVGDQVTVSWSAPMGRVTKYVVEWASAPDGSWQEVPREWPMNLAETFTAHDAPVWVRVTAYEDSIPATPSHPLPALGA